MKAPAPGGIAPGFESAIQIASPSTSQADISRLKARLLMPRATLVEASPPGSAGHDRVDRGQKGNFLLYLLGLI